MPGPVKLSGLPYDNSPSINDWLVGIQNAGTTDSKFKLSDIITLIASQNLFSSAVTSYSANGTNTTGTGYYVNLGGIKLCWGNTSNTPLVSGANYQFLSCTIAFPIGFFNSVQMGMAYPSNVSASEYIGIAGDAYSTTGISFFVSQMGSGTNGGSSVSWFAIGT